MNSPKRKWHQFLAEARAQWHLESADLAGVESAGELVKLLQTKLDFSPRRAESEVAGLAKQFERKLQQAA